MKVPAEKIKARSLQLQKEGMKVQATLELNAGFKEPALRSNTKAGQVRQPSDQKAMKVPVSN